MVLQVSTVERSVAGVVCLSLPFSGPADFSPSIPEGDDMSTMDNLMALTCPVMFVHGDRCVNYRWGDCQPDIP